MRSAAGFYFRPPHQSRARVSDPAGIRCDCHELGRFVLQRLVPAIGPFPYPPHELMLMCAAVIWLRPQLIVEWGTSVGASARVWWETTQRYGLNAEIHSIDLPPGVGHFEHPGRNRGVLVRGLSVALHQGDGAEVACDLISAGHVEDPLVFIDGDHAASAVLLEGSAIWRLRPAASILFHDTFEAPGGPSGPREALRQLLAMRKDKPRLYVTPARINARISDKEQTGEGSK